MLSPYRQGVPLFHGLFVCIFLQAFFASGYLLCQMDVKILSSAVVDVEEQKQKFKNLVVDLIKMEFKKRKALFI